MEQYRKAERNAKVALHAKMKGLGFRMVSDSEWVSGVRRVVELGTGEFEPWTTFWNPGVRFETPEAAVVWADIEGWGVGGVVFEGEIVLEYTETGDYHTGLYESLRQGTTNLPALTGCPAGEVKAFRVGEKRFEFTSPRVMSPGCTLRLTTRLEAELRGSDTRGQG